MPAIIPVSDLKNYTSVVNQVSYGNRVYVNYSAIELPEHLICGACAP